MSGDVRLLAGNLGTELLGFHEPVILAAIASALEDLVVDGIHPPDGELALAAQLLQRLAIVAATVRRCRACGCTDNHACPEGCSWVEEDLCSACGHIAEANA